jgi:pimeloyl-ACP methyl ester carboxylesterase
MAANLFNRRNVLGAALSALLSGRAGAAPPAGAYEVHGGQFSSFDGETLFYRRVGEGPPVLLLHGLLGDGPRTWFSTGIAQSLAAAGFSAIAPDARAHGLSAAPTDASAYPADVQAMDVEALIRVLKLGSVRVVGYAMGARTAVRLMARGDKVERCVLGGVGDRSVTDTERLTKAYEEAILHGRSARDPLIGVTVQAAIRLQRMKPGALLALVRSERSTPAAALARIRTPVLVISGRTDKLEGTAERLASLLPAARAEHIVGSHLAALRDPRFTLLASAFLTSRSPPSRFAAPPAPTVFSERG